jgi:hypothetical protein
VSSAADRDALSHGYEIAPLAQGLTAPTFQLRPAVHHGRTDRRVCRHPPYRLPLVLLDSPAKTVNRPTVWKGDSRFESHFLRRRVSSQLCVFGRMAPCRADDGSNPSPFSDESGANRGVAPTDRDRRNAAANQTKGFAWYGAAAVHAEADAGKAGWVAGPARSLRPAPGSRRGDQRAVGCSAG